MKKAIVFVLLALIVLGGLSLIALIPQVEAQGGAVMPHDVHVCYRVHSYGWDVENDGPPGGEDKACSDADMFWLLHILTRRISQTPFSIFYFITSTARIPKLLSFGRNRRPQNLIFLNDWYQKVWILDLLN